MITHEFDGEHYIVTILDDTGHDEELQLVWAEGGELFTVIQHYEEVEDTVIHMTPLQATLLRDILNMVIIEEDA